MPADPNALARRLAAATPADTTRGYHFNAVFALVGRELGDAAARSLDPAGKATRTEFLAYPIAEFLPIAWRAVDALERRHGGVEAAWTAIGTESVRRFTDSIIGRTLFAIAGRDPRRIADALPAGYAASVSYGERTLRWTGERSVAVSFRRDFTPAAFHRGVMLGGLAATDARDVLVSARDTGFLDSEYEASWR